MDRRTSIGLTSLAFVYTVASALPATIPAGAIGTGAALCDAFVAGTSAGMYRSLDAGRTWQKADTGLPAHSYIATLARSHQGSIYANTWYGSVYLSRDAGAYWVRVSMPPPRTFEAMAVDPADARRLFAVTGGDGIDVSSDGGATWVHINGNGALLSSVGAIAINPRNSSTLLAGSNGRGVLKSSDRGRTWKLAGDFPHSVVYGLAFNPVNPEVAFAATSAGIYETIDSTATWQPSRRGMRGVVDFRSIAVDDRNGAHIVAGSHGGDIYNSVDGGTSWTRVANASGFPIYAIAFDPVQGGHILIGDNFGLMESRDHGATWRSLSSLEGHQITMLTAASCYAQSG